MSSGLGQRVNAAVTEFDPLVGRILNGRFTVLELIGAGGMGRVYKANQSPLDRIVALKILNSYYSDPQDTGFQKRFFFEASMMAKLHHPNTVTIIDCGRTKDGIFYIAMEYIQGVTLGQVVSSSGPIHWARVLHITQQICSSLREAHKLGIVHRDIKPANVMLVRDSHEQDLVKVLDFGLVKSFLPDGQGGPAEQDLTEAGTLLGSPMYMAPEQAKNLADPRSDIYSLGLVVYQMLTGKPPFCSKEAIEIILKQVKDPPPAMRSIKPDLQVPPGLEKVVFRCLEKDPEKRFQNMDEMLDGLRRAAAAAGIRGTLRPFAGRSIAYAAKPVRPVFSAARASGKQERDLSIARVLGRVRDRAKIALIAAPVVLAIAIGLTGFRIGTHAATSAALEARDSQVKQAPVEVAPAPVPALARKMVHFVIRSEPPGATVIMEGRNLGITPVDFQLEPDQEGLATAELALSMEGFRPTTISASGSGPEVVLTQRLRKLKQKAPSTSADEPSP